MVKQKNDCHFIGKRFEGLERERRECLEWSLTNNPLAVDPCVIREKGREGFDGLYTKG